MSKSNAITVLPPDLNKAEVESYYTNFQRMGEVHGCLLIGFQGMQGLCLETLRRLHGGGEKGGRPKTSEACGGFVAWPVYLKQKFGISADTADRMMKVWAGMQPRIGKLPVSDQKAFLGLLTKPFSSFAPADLTRLRDLTRKVTPADSVTAFLIECGITRGPRKDPGTLAKTSSSGERKPADTALIIQDELFGRVAQTGEMYEWWAKPVKIGKARVPVWQTMTEAQKAAMEKGLELSIRQSTEMLTQLQEAKKRK